MKRLLKISLLFALAGTLSISAFATGGSSGGGKGGDRAQCAVGRTKQHLGSVRAYGDQDVQNLTLHLESACNLAYAHAKCIATNAIADSEGDVSKIVNQCLTRSTLHGELHQLSRY